MKIETFGIVLLTFMLFYHYYFLFLPAGLSLLPDQAGDGKLPEESLISWTLVCFLCQWKQKRVCLVPPDGFLTFISLSWVPGTFCRWGLKPRLLGSMEQHEAAAAAYVRWIFSFHFLQALLLFAQVHLLLVAPCPPSVAVYL